MNFSSKISNTFSQSIRFIPILLTFAAIGASDGNLLVIIIFTLLPFYTISAHNGFEYNPSTGEFRVYKSTFGIRSGNWTKLPSVDYLYITRSASAFGLSYGGIISSGTIATASTKVILFCHHKEIQIPIYISLTSSECFNKAKALAELLNCEIHDYTKRELQIISKPLAQTF